MPDRTEFVERQGFGRNLAFFLRVPAVLLAIFGAYIIISALSDEIPVAGKLALVGLGIVTGGVIPWLLWSMHLRVTVDNDAYTVALWPLPLRRSVQLTSITDVVTRTVDPMTEYGGWGVKGKSADMLFSVGGVEAVSVVYRDGGEKKKLTVTSPRAEDLRETLHAVVS